MDLISIIVPVYNVEQYLRDCIESIINQSYRNLQIILVDDGSLDDCPRICDEYACKDHRIEVIHKENGGLTLVMWGSIKLAENIYLLLIVMIG